MAEENKNALQRGVVVEFDFTAIDGSQLLFETAKKVLNGHGVDLTVKLEAMRLVGGNYQGGLSELFEFLGSKADAAKVAQELAEAFRAALGTQQGAPVRLSARLRLTPDCACAPGYAQQEYPAH